MAPLVTIIIPCFNGGPLLSKTIDSALSQTYPNVEVLVVDDGSTDGSLDLIKGYGSKVRWSTGPNQGVSSAFNQGMAMAKGEYVQFVGADDLLHPQKIELSVQVFQKHPEVDFVWAPNKTFSDVRELTEWDGPRKLEELQVTFGTDALEAVYAPSAAVLKTSLLKQVGLFDVALRRWVDLEYHARLAVVSQKHARIHFPLYGYRQHEGPRISTANKKHTNVENGLLALRGTHKALEHPNIKPAARKKVLFPFYVLMARSAAAAGNAAAFKECLTEAMNQATSPKFAFKAKAALAASKVLGLKTVSLLMEKALK